jgi:hypothetical protein
MAHSIKLDDLSMSDLQSLIADAQRALTGKVDAERAELMKKLHALDAISGKSSKAERGRSSPKPQYRGPNGEEFSGRGGIPRWAKELGIKDKAGLEPYRIKE